MEDIQMEDIDSRAPSSSPSTTEVPLDEFKAQLNSLNELSSLDQILSTASELGNPDAAILLVQTITSLRPHIQSWLLSQLFEMRYDQSEAPEDLQQSINHAAAAVAVTQPTDFSYGRLHRDLASQLFTRYEASDSLTDLEVVITQIEETLTGLPPSDPYYIELLEVLSFRYATKYQHTEVEADITCAITLAQAVVAATPSTDSNCGGRTMALSNLHSDRYDAIDDLSDLTAAIQLAEQALTLPYLDPYDLARRHATLAVFLSQRYERLSILQDLNEAIRHGEEAVAMTPADDPDRLIALNNLGNFITARYDLLGDLKDLERRNNLRAEISTDAPEPETAAELSWIRYHRSSALEDLERAVKGAEIALEMAADEEARVQRMRRLARFLCERYERLADSDDMQKSIACIEYAVAAGDPQRVGDLENLGRFLYRRYQELERMEDLDRAIEMAEEAVAGTERDDESWSGRMDSLGTFRMARYEKTMATDDLEQAITNMKAVLGASSVKDKDRGDRLGNLGLHLRLRFALKADLADIEEAIVVYGEALAESPGRTAYELGMAACLNDRYHKFGELKDLDMAIKWAEEASKNVGDGELMQANVLINLGMRLHTRYERLGVQEDLENALRRMTEALAATPEGHLETIAPLVNMSICYGKRHQLLRNVEDLEKSVSLAETAFEAMPERHPYQAWLLLLVGSTRQARYLKFGEMADLEEALKRTGEALGAFEEESQPNDQLTRATPDKGRYFIFDNDKITDNRYHHTRAIALSNLGTLHRLRYESLGSLGDVEMAVKRCTEAVNAAPNNHPNRPEILGNLSTSLHSRFERLRNLSDLEQAIKLSDDVASSIPVDHPQRPGVFVDHASGLALRYHRLGNAKDLEMAIKITSDTRPNNIDEEVALKSMGDRFLDRYHRFQAFEDLEKAIQWTEAALALAPRGHRGYAETLANLGNMLAARYSRMGTVQDLEQAIKFNKEALELTPVGNTKRLGMLMDLNDNLGASYRNSKAAEDLEEGIKVCREALGATPSGHPDRSNALFREAVWLRARYELLKELADLEAAIKSAEEALTLTQLDDPYRSEVLFELAALVFLRQPEDPEYSLQLFINAWECSSAKPTTRIEAANRAALLLALAERWEESWAIIGNAVELMPQASPHWLRREDRQHFLSSFGGRIEEALSIALQAEEDPWRCLRLLELIRGTIIGFTIDCRSDISELREKHEFAYQRFNRLRMEIDSPYTSNRRKEAIEEMEEALTHIRQLPGFDSFQLAPSPESLIEMAQDGPVITINSTIFRSDALIVTSSGIKLVNLPDLSYEDVKSFTPAIPKLARGGLSTYSARNTTLSKHLQWLWDKAVEPILNELGFGEAADGEKANLPHVWWIGTGILALAPFHAAGDHSPGSTRNTMSRVVSSIIPTIKALSYAREKKFELLGKSDARLLLVTMPKTPGKKPLVNAELEADDIVAAVHSRTAATKFSQPSAADVLTNLASYHAIHFACHGVSDNANPSNSHLVLVKDSDRGETEDHLTVGTISSTNIKHAQLAYLSACSTASNSPGPLADEALHLAGAFQLAGFSHVIATLWESNDSACRQVASDFYRELFDGKREINGWKVRVEFHKAVGRLREGYLGQPLRWAGFVHMGA